MTNIKERIKKIPKPLIASIVYMAVVFFQNGINLITTPIFSRILTTSEYGITSTYQSWYNILTIFVTLNLSAGVYNNALLDFDKKRNKMTSSFLSISITLSIIFFFIYVLFKNQIKNLLGLSEYLIDFMFVNFLTAPAWGFFITKEKFDYKYIKPLILTIITFILNPIIGIIGINLFPNNKAVSKVIFCGLPTLLVNTIMLVSILKKGKCFFNKTFWKYALSFNIPLIPHYLSNVILAQSDRIMIQKMISDSAAGIYGVSYNLSMVVQGVFTGINAAWIPFTYKRLKSNNYNKIGKYSNVLLLFITFISLVLILCAPEIIKILAPIEYYSAIWVIPPIVLGLYFSFLSSLFANVEFYYKKNIFVTIATTCAAILNIILNFIFIPKFGFIAAGYTTLIGYIALTIAHFIFMRKIQPQKIYDTKTLFKISISVIITALIFTCLYNFLVIRYIIIFIVVLIILLNLKKITKVIREFERRE